MEIREFYGRETIKFQKLKCSLIRCGNPKLLDEEKYAEELEQEEKNLDKDFFRIGVFEEDRLWATIRSEPFFVNLDGKEIKISGTGGVLADFNAPQKGLIKALFRKGFEMMRERGQFLSHLYPFQANYYRQYGYEISCKHYLWKIPVEYISNDCSGKYVFYDGSDKMKQDIVNVYNRFAKNHNLSPVKTEKMWERFFEAVMPYKDEFLSYLHYSGEQADAFMSYRVVSNEERPQDLYVDTLWYTDYRGLRGILSYFVSQKPYADRILVKTPVNVDLAACNEFQGGWAKRDTICETIYDGTTRVVDVEKILQIVGYRGTGTVTVQIENDNYCPWNNDCFTVSFGEKTTVTRGGEPDIVMDINAFSAMILGAVDLESGLIFPHVKIYGKKDELEKMFYKKNMYIDVHF